MTYLGRLVARAGGPVPGALRPRPAGRFERPAELPGAGPPPPEPGNGDSAPAPQDPPAGPAPPVAASWTLLTPPTPVPRVPAALRPQDIAHDGRGLAGTVTGAPTAATGEPPEQPATRATPAASTGPEVSTPGPAPVHAADAESVMGRVVPLGPQHTLDRETVQAPRPGAGPTASLQPSRPSGDRTTEWAPEVWPELVVFADDREPIAGLGHERASAPSTDAADGSGPRPPAPSARARPGAMPAPRTTIEVTIGRIEVRAAAERRERPAPRRRPSPPVALDDYLGQRRGS